MIHLIEHAGYYLASDEKVQASEDIVKALPSVNSLQALYDLIGDDFYVIVPCPGVHGDGKVYEGTRLTLIEHDPDGFDFFIRTPSTPERWADFDQEMTCSFNSSVDFFSTVKQDNQNNPVLIRALEFFYLWVIFSPITRGTAACGYAAMYAIILGNGLMFASPQPKDVQLDLEAIFAPNMKDFITFASSLLSVKESTIDLESLEGDLRELATLRTMLQIVTLAKLEE